MSDKIELDLPGKNHYKLLYQHELEQEAEWLRRGAVEKTNSIQYLLEHNGLKPKTILELGCGTGAVIQECQSRGIGEEYIAVDYSEEVIAYLRDKSEGIDAIVADITAPNFALEGTFDLVILSHVLEHLEEPLQFLTSISQKISFSLLIIEVPLEDLLAGRLKQVYRDRKKNKAGHVQFFNAETLTRLLAQSDLKIIDKRQYAPVLDLETVRFICAKDGLTKTKHLVKAFTYHYLPRMLRPLWLRLYYAHFAALCESQPRTLSHN